MLELGLQQIIFIHVHVALGSQEYAKIGHRVPSYEQ